MGGCRRGSSAEEQPTVSPQERTALGTEQAKAPASTRPAAVKNSVMKKIQNSIHDQSHCPQVSDTASPLGLWPSQRQALGPATCSPWAPPQGHAWGHCCGTRQGALRAESRGGPLSPAAGRPLPTPTTYLRVNSWCEDRGDPKQAVVEGNFLQRVVTHGPHHHHIPKPFIRETLGMGCVSHHTG